MVILKRQKFKPNNVIAAVLSVTRPIDCPTAMDMFAPIPPVLPPKILPIPGFSTVYGRCVTLQTQAHLLQLDPPPSPSAVVTARILGYLLIYVPGGTQAGRHAVARSINRCAKYLGLIDLARIICDYFIRLFRSTKGSTPADNSSISGESFDVLKDAAVHLMTKSPPDQKTAKMHVLARACQV
ncbi:hypothetical protein BDR03DRAFT_605333 [Suillus americanus]|nr:hypothetical protein BDR03DRAFT_605333 [Suillus americanus]